MAALDKGVHEIIVSMSDDEWSLLPNDLISEILIKLPAKSLVRLRSTCKTWNSLLTNPLFAESHFHHLSSSPQNLPLVPSYLFFQSDSVIFSIDLSLNLIRKEHTDDVDRNLVSLAPAFRTTREGKGYRPLGSCNGLVCIHVINANTIFIWNPITNECRDIQSPIKGYNILRSGFGFASSINDYKLLLVVATGYTRQSPSIIYVYSFRKKEWRLIDFDVAVVKGSSSVTFAELNSELFGYRFGGSAVLEAVQLSETLHWIVGPHNTGSKSKYFILKFDLVNEIFDSTLDLKRTITKGIKEEDMYSLAACIGISRRNNLCVCQTFRSRGTPTCVEIWMLDGYDNEGYASWKKLFRHRGDWRYLGDDHRLLGITGHARVVIMEKKKTNMDFMLVLDASQNPLKYVQVNNKYSAPHKRGDRIAYSIGYVETLISPTILFE